MRPTLQRLAFRAAAALTIAALVQVGFAATVLAVHAAHDDHDLLEHGQWAGIESILHGHDHHRGSPDHDHSFVSAKPAPQYFGRNQRQAPPPAASTAVRSSTLKLPLSLHRTTALCGPDPPSLSRTFVVLRI